MKKISKIVLKCVFKNFKNFKIFYLFIKSKINRVFKNQNNSIVYDRPSGKLLYHKPVIVKDTYF